MVFLLTSLLIYAIILTYRVIVLTEAILKHRNQTGNSLCWENDLELWNVIGKTTYPHETLPPRTEFLRNCQLYYESRLDETERKTNRRVGIDSCRN